MQAGCASDWDSYHSGYITDDVLCAEPPGGEGYGTCKGDSGGPLTVKTGPKHYLAGVTSFGLGCGNVSLKKQHKNYSFKNFQISN